MSPLYSVGHYEIGDSELCDVVDTVCQLLKNFAQDNLLSATLNPYINCKDKSGFYTYNPVTHTPDTLFLYTSGTTGTPKLIEKNNMYLFMQNKKGGGSGDDRWVLTYHPFRWAGITLLAHLIRHKSFFIVPDALDTKSILLAAKNVGATHISLTPSLFRQMIIGQNELLSSCAFQQITFGGEVASQTILDQAKHFFPNARVTHTYASTEAGDICAVSDGLEGFPVTKFSTAVRLEDGELILNEKPTGDLWKIRGDRMYFVGRKTDVVNVGGDKISLSYVENKLMCLSGVKQARAKVETSPIVGNIITVDYVGEIEPRDIMVAARQILPKYAVSKVYKTDYLELTEAGKIKR